MEKKTNEFFLFPAVFNMDVGLATLAEDLKREMLDICLNLRIIKLASDKTFRIEDTAEQ